MSIHHLKGTNINSLCARVFAKEKAYLLGNIPIYLFSKLVVFACLFSVKLVMKEFLYFKQFSLTSEGKRNFFQDFLQKILLPAEYFLLCRVLSIVRLLFYQICLILVLLTEYSIRHSVHVTKPQRISAKYSSEVG